MPTRGRIGLLRTPWHPRAPGCRITSAPSPLPSSAAEALADAFAADNDDYRAIMVPRPSPTVWPRPSRSVSTKSRGSQWYAPCRADDRGADRRAVPRHSPGVRLSGVPRPLREGDAARRCSRQSVQGSVSPSRVQRQPGSSVSGLYFGHPQARYFSRRAGRPRPGRRLRRAGGACSVRPSDGSARISRTSRKPPYCETNARCPVRRRRCATRPRAISRPRWRGSSHDI